MKILNPDGSVSIPSNLPRTHLGLDSRGFRICVSQIGRSCATDTGFITFTDGSAYVYDPPSKDEFEALCASIHRGREFNLAVRRSRSGYVRGFTPPPDYEIIYSYPPYLGSVPAACPVPPVPWPNLTWVTNIIFLDDGQSMTFIPTAGVSASMEMDFASGSTNVGGDCTATGTAIYNGAGETAGLHLVETGGSSGTPGNFHVVVTQDGSTLLDNNYDASSPFDSPESLAFADTGGADSTIVVFIEWTSGGTFPFTAWVFTATAS